MRYGHLQRITYYIVGLFCDQPNRRTVDERNRKNFGIIIGICICFIYEIICGNIFQNLIAERTKLNDIYVWIITGFISLIVGIPYGSLLLQIHKEVGKILVHFGAAIFINLSLAVLWSRKAE